MSLRINTNTDAINSYRNLSNTQNSISKSLEKLSSGLRINRAADDAAGLSISEGLRSQIGGLKVAVRNAQDGISVAQTAEGALTEVHRMLQRMNDLSVQYANGTQNADSRKALESEFSQLSEEISRIQDQTKFNGEGLFTGTAMDFQTGYAKSDKISISTTALAAFATVSTGTAATTGTAGSFTTSAAPAAAANAVITGGVNGKTFSVTNGTTAITTAAQAVTLLNSDAGFSEHFTAVADGANLKITEKVASTGSITLTGLGAGVAAAGTAGTPATAAGALTIGAGASAVTLDIADSGTVQKAITQISAQRSELGAIQNRFEHTINNINVTTENLSAAESRIRDADMAEEMVTFTKNNILSQAGTAMLAQANQATQSVLSLLR